MRTHITGSRYDSTLEIRGTTAKLTMEMNVQFIAVDGNSSFPSRLTISPLPLHVASGINGELTDDYGVYPLVRWNNATEFVPLQQKLKNGIENAWNNKYWLIPNRGWYRNDATHVDEGLSVECAVQINIVSLRPHFTAYCIKPLSSVGNGREPNEQSPTFRSYVHEDSWGIFTINDAQSKNKGLEKGIEIMIAVDIDKDGTPEFWDNQPFAYQQVTIAHEFSHIIGLSHVNGEGNADWRYGKNYDQRRQISGRGMDILPTHMMPWKNRLIRHLHPKHVGWRFASTPERHFYTGRHGRRGDYI